MNIQDLVVGAIYRPIQMGDKYDGIRVKLLDIKEDGSLDFEESRGRDVGYIHRGWQINYIEMLPPLEALAQAAE